MIRIQRNHCHNSVDRGQQQHVCKNNNHNNHNNQCWLFHSMHYTSHQLLHRNRKKPRTGAVR